MAKQVEGSGQIGVKPIVPVPGDRSPPLPNVSDRIPPGPVEQPDPRTGRRPGRNPGRSRQPEPNRQPTPPDIGNDHAYLAFSGGGWNSHSMLAGMISGALDELEDSGQPRSLSKLLESVEGISANSGGSWFLSMLAYSRNFSSIFENRNTNNQYKSNRGFNGQTRQLFLGFPVNSALEAGIQSVLSSAGVSQSTINRVRDWMSLAGRFASHLGENGLNWRSFVEKLVYKPLGMFDELKHTLLTDPRQDWATDKDLIIASALQTAPTVLDARERGWYSVTDSSMWAKGSLNTPGWSNLKSQTTPLTYYSEVKEPGTQPIAKVLLNGGNGTIYYSNNGSPLGNNDPAATSQTIPSLWTSEDVYPSTNPLVLDATIASSSFLALLASPKSTEDLIGFEPAQNYIAELAKDLAPYTTFGKKNSSYTMDTFNQHAFPMVPSDSSDSDIFESVYSQYTEGRAAKLADGGYADNTAAANMLRHIQDTDGTIAPFELTIFANSSDDPVTGIQMKVGNNGELSEFRLPTDVAALFGNSDGRNNDGKVIEGPLPWQGDKIISPQIFSPSAWIGESADWSYSQGDVDISYYQLNVRTMANDDFGIKPNQRGKVNLFVASNKDSFAGPIMPQYLDAYDENFDVYRKAIGSQGGFNFIKDAFNLSNVG
jgi:hypothetical protein